MKIILLKDVAKVGKKYETKNISDGYAINLLIPKGLAIAATPDAIKRIELERSKDEGEKKIHHELLLKNIKELDGVTINLTEKANDKGHLFAGVHKLEIIPAIEKQTRIQISPEYIVLDKPIKEVGLHEVEVRVGEISVKFNLDIKAQ
jgi:large subunit ribosomal protein L9